MKRILLGCMVLGAFIAYILVFPKDIPPDAKTGSIVPVSLEYPLLTMIEADPNSIPNSTVIGKKNSVVEVVAAQCQNLAGLKTDLQTSKEKRNLTIIDFTRQLKTLQLAKQRQEAIGQHAAVPLNVFRRLTGKYRDLNMNSLMHMDGKSVRVPNAVQNQFEQHLRDKNYDGIIMQIRSGELVTNSSVGSHSVLSRVLLRDKAIDIEIVKELIDAGLTPSFPDFVRMTATNRDLELIELLVRSSEDDVNKYWYNNDHFNNLTMLAAEKLNSSLFNFWLAQGSKMAVKINDYTALDVMKTPTSEYELVQASSIFVELANRTVLPYKADTMDRVKAWLPAKLQHTYADYLNRYEAPVLSGFELQKSDELTVSLRFIDDELSVIEQSLLAVGLWREG